MGNPVKLVSKGIYSMNQESLLESSKGQLRQEGPLPAPQLSEAHGSLSLLSLRHAPSSAAQSPASGHSSNRWLPYWTSLIRNP